MNVRSRDRAAAGVRPRPHRVDRPPPAEPTAVPGRSRAPSVGLRASTAASGAVVPTMGNRDRPAGRHDPSRIQASQPPTPAACSAITIWRGPGCGSGKVWIRDDRGRPEAVDGGGLHREARRGLRAAPHDAARTAPVHVDAVIEAGIPVASAGRGQVQQVVSTPDDQIFPAFVQFIREPRMGRVAVADRAVRVLAAEVVLEGAVSRADEAQPPPACRQRLTSPHRPTRRRRGNRGRFT